MTSGTPDVVVLGGSAAGLFSADLLARAGARVRVFDAAGPEQDARTLIVTPRLSDALGFTPAAATLNRLHTIQLRSARRTVTVPLAEPDLVVERTAILRLLAERALQGGAEIITGYRLAAMAPTRAGALLTLRDLKRDRTEEIEAPIVIGADGGFSTVARATDRRVRQTVPIVQTLVPLPAGMREDETVVWFDPGLTPYFVWLIPESRTRAALGLIARDGRTAFAALTSVARRLGVDAMELQAARVPLFRPRPRPWATCGGATVYLVGDAAGHVKVTTVGGLVTGLRGARAVAEAILGERPYRATLRPLTRELTVHRWVRAVLDRLRADDYDALLGALEGSAAALLSATSRDELARIFLRLLVTQPRFLLFARRLLAP
jgi:flavin-dependent dehydrogenase